MKKSVPSTTSRPASDEVISNTPASSMSRRQLVQSAGAAALTMALGSSESAKAQVQAQATEVHEKPLAGPGGPPQGGRGPIRVLLFTKYHPFARGVFYDMWDSLGDVITWTHVDQPAGRTFLSDPKNLALFDVLVFYDMDGRAPVVGAPTPGAPPRQTVFLTPTPEEKAGFEAILKRGDKGIVFFHHSIASWTHNWPEYGEVIGGRADWRDPMTVRGKEYPYSGYNMEQKQHITIVDKTHPVVAGLGDGYDITDEVYLSPMFEDSVHCLARTDYKQIDSNYPLQTARGWHHPPGSNMCVWVKTAENTPITYIQHGHGPSAWTNPAFQKLMTNAITWVNTPEAKDWAKKNPSKIFSA